MMKNVTVFAVICAICTAMFWSAGAVNRREPNRPHEGETVQNDLPPSGEHHSTDEGETSLPEETDGKDALTSSPPTLPEPSAPEEQTISVYLAAEEQTVEMDLEEYIVHTVMAEVPHTFPIEALKAQAVAARTYCLYRIELGGKHAGGDAGICTDYAHCMAYLSDEEAIERWGEENANTIRETIAEAVEATRGQVLTHRGKLIAALFHASSTGKTENAENVWGNPYPYLLAVDTPEEPRISERRVPLSDLMAVMKTAGEPDFSSVLFEKKGISLSFNSTGRIERLTVNGYTIKGTVLRSKLSLRSTDFTAELCEDGQTVLFTVTGNGHGIGMSQYGADAMAKNGADYREILEHYYTGIEIEQMPQRG